ncbi:MAG: glycosyltransferase family 4 protein, partial [Pseudomonadota bacterium]
LEGDARDPRSWSGTPSYRSRALENHWAGVSYIGPVEPRILPVLNKLARLQRRWTGINLLPSQSPLALRAYGRILGRALAEHRPQAVIAPAGSALVAALETDLPVIYSSDATVRVMLGYYGHFSDLSPATLARVEALEQRAIDRADLLLYPTAWAAQSAIDDYGADPGKVHILPYGANMRELPGADAALRPRLPGPLRLLFVGVDWVRKGGPIAVAALAALRRGGVEAQMTVVGCIPPPDVSREGLTVIPFLDKNDPGQARHLSRLYGDADLLFVPTRSECYGIVFCEAAAHGVPSISTATGGVPGVILEGVTGHLLPPEADGAAYAELIARVAASPDAPDGPLARLARSARADYDARLNWERWAAQATALVTA